MGPEQSGFYDGEFGDYVEQYDNSFTPTYFEPHLKLFKIPKSCPKEMVLEIENSFKLFWTDLSSCVNKIRISVEILLNEQKVKRFELKGGKRYPLSLHKRIMAFTNTEVKDNLLAIKWVGNSGSHSGEVETIDALEVYRLLEYSLNKIYNSEEKEIKKSIRRMV